MNESWTSREWENKRTQTLNQHLSQDSLRVSGKAWKCETLRSEWRLASTKPLTWRSCGHCEENFEFWTRGSNTWFSSRQASLRYCYPQAQDLLMFGRVWFAVQAPYDAFCFGLSSTLTWTKKTFAVTQAKSKISLSCATITSQNLKQRVHDFSFSKPQFFARIENISVFRHSWIISTETYDRKW